MTKKFLSLFLFVVASMQGQMVLTNAAPSSTIDFSASMQATVGNGAFTGSGFQATPVSGQLSSNAWAVTGWSNGNLLFGGTQTTATTDYTRGATAVAISTGGMYAFTGVPQSVTNPCLMIQPGGSDFAPGTLTLRIQNNGISNITDLALTYNLFVRNDQGRSNSFNFSYSLDDVTYTAVGALDYTSLVAADALGWVQVGTSPSRSTSITGLNIAPGGYIYLRWSSADIGGTGSRDEFGLDDISCAATFITPCTPPANPTGTITGTTPACGSATLTFTGTATAPVVNYWQTTPTGTSTANNAATPLNVTASGTYYVRAFNSATSCWSTGNVASSAITIVPAVNITTQPVNQSIASAQNTSFSVVATSATAYQWQVSTDNGVTWANLTNTPPYSTVTTATMNITNATFGMNGYRYRCIVSGTAPCGAVNSNAGILSVVNAINTLANLGTQVTAAFVPQATLDHVLFKFQVSPTVTTNLQGIANVVTAGTYISADVLNLKVRYSADNVLDITDVTLSTLATPGVAGTKTFPAFTTQSIIGGTTGYIFITADISATAIIGNTISLNAVTTANLIFSLGIKTGSTTNGGTQTIAPSAPNLPATFTRGCSSNTTQVLNWSAPLTGPFDGYMIVARESGLNPHAVTSLVASTQPFNTDFSLAPTYGSTAPLSRVVYNGTGTTATITGLTPGATYVYEIYTYRNNGPTNTVFSTTPRSLTQVAALSNVTNAIATPGNTTGLIGWANPNALCFDQVLVVVTAAPGITFAPTGDGSAYTANPAFAAF
ncbi:hypothetical protein, partial [Flavobacterium sp.]|uniref:fibronectin type III domain-containing protein n=1 Tax=Flavobacterium sp. TaxID=239 RepID=UPI00333E596F